MANFLISVDKTLRHEGGFVHVKATGEVANFGITVWFLREIGELPPAPRTDPARPTEISFVRRLTRDQAVEIYRRHFWERYRIGEIRDQDLADKVFDLVVNTGPGGWASIKGRRVFKRGALVLLQEAVNELRGKPLLDCDGILGPISLARVNSTEAGALLDVLRAKAADRYRSIAAANPPLAPNLHGWLERLAA
jgi:lysozyme family protein